MANTTENSATTSTRPASIPIPIGRPRSSSTASSNPPELSTSASSSPPQTALRTPFPLSPASPTFSKFLQTAPIISTSPTASRLAGYFAQTPTASNGSALDTADEGVEEFRQRASGRRMSTGWAGRPFPPSSAAPAAPSGPPAAEQGAGLLRRFSLSGAFGRPFVAPPPTAPVTGPLAAANEAKTMPTIVEPTPIPAQAQSQTDAQVSPTGSVRGRTLGTPKRPRRSVSPMSERILKGQFDGFV